MRRDIAESFLRMMRRDRGHMHVGYYVRLAAREGVPFGRIVALSGLSSEVVSVALEGVA